MKVEVIEKEEAVEYPYLGKSESNGDIVLFTARKTGMCIASNKGHIGQYLVEGTGWNENNFKQLNGKVILEND
jgi:hypothetical protein